jgi:hypothetical protein
VVKGLVTGVGPGSVTITASLDGRSGSTTVVVGLTATIVITPTGADPLSKAVTPQQQFTATATYSDSTVLDLTNYAIWMSSAEAVLTLNDFYFPGLATLVAPGTATVTATLTTGETDSVTVTVVP